MATRRAGDDRVPLLQGTSDLLILRTLVFGPQHGQGIVAAIEQQPEEALLVDHGSLYPALQRLEDRGAIAAKWGTSDNNLGRTFTRSPGRVARSWSPSRASGGGWRPRLV
jgi:PadR family transcriptional regulator